MFGWQNVILLADLTLLNINMSKNSTSGDFSRKKFVFSMIIRIFASSVPTKPLNDAQMRGAFFVSVLSYYGVGSNAHIQSISK